MSLPNDNMKPVTDFGDHLTLEVFVDSVKEGLFIDSMGLDTTPMLLMYLRFKLFHRE